MKEDLHTITTQFPPEATKAFTIGTTMKLYSFNEEVGSITLISMTANFQNWKVDPHCQYYRMAKMGIHIPVGIAPFGVG